MVWWSRLTRYLPNRLIKYIELVMIELLLAFRRVRYGIRQPIIHVDPNEITRFTALRINKALDCGCVKDGDWDISDSPQIFSTVWYQSLVKRFQEGARWEDTEMYNKLLKKVDSGKTTHRGYSTVAEVEQRFEELDKLYESIVTYGYMSQTELSENDVDDPVRWRRFGQRHRYLDEVLVMIGRDGSFLFFDGRHRLTIAQILALNEIPVFVIARHAGWQKIRERYANAESFDDVPPQYQKFADHPDIQDVHPDFDRNRFWGLFKILS